MRDFVKMAKVAKASIYIIVCIFIVFIGMFPIVFFLLISLGYALIELLRTESHKVISLGNFMARLFIIIVDFGCVVALSIFRSDDEDRTRQFVYSACIVLLTTSILLSITIALIYDCCPGNALLQDQD